MSQEDALTSYGFQLDRCVIHQQQWQMGNKVSEICWLPNGDGYRIAGVIPIDDGGIFW